MEFSTIILTLLIVWALGGFDNKKCQDLSHYDDSIDDFYSELLELSDRVSKLEK